MSSKADFFIKNVLGEDFFESLQKFELWKPGTKTTIDHEEIHTALKIVPRAVMAILIRELAPMNIGEAKEIDIPCEKSTILKVTKHERDVYSGTVDQENKTMVDFKYRSIPGIGLVIMSALELYDVEDLSHPAQPSEDITDKVQKIIDERLALHDLVNKVVERKLMEKDAIQQLLLAKISEKLHEPQAQPVVNIPLESLQGSKEMSKSDKKSKKTSPLGDFLEQRKSKKNLKKNEFSIQLAKNEQVNCPDCRGSIFDGNVFSGCICVGDDMEKKVFLKKTEDGIQVRFSKGWDEENIEMLLEVLRRKNG